MKYKQILKTILAGDWQGLEVHDKRNLSLAVMWSLGVMFLIGTATSIQSCSPQPDLPSHIQVNGE